MCSQTRREQVKSLMKHFTAKKMGKFNNTAQVPIPIKEEWQISGFLRFNKILYIPLAREKETLLLGNS